jgi:hypothetical protein
LDGDRAIVQELSTAEENIRDVNARIRQGREKSAAISDLRGIRSEVDGAQTTVVVLDTKRAGHGKGLN